MVVVVAVNIEFETCKLQRACDNNEKHIIKRERESSGTEALRGESDSFR